MKKLILILIILLFGCSAEQKEISRQEDIIRTFMDVYFDEEPLSETECTIVVNSNNPEDAIAFVECIKVEAENRYGEYLSSEILENFSQAIFNRAMMNTYYGHEYEVIEYELTVPENLDFPNVFQIKVKEFVESDTLEYLINVKVEGDKITEWSQHPVR